MKIDILRDEQIRKQKKGLPFIIASVVIWGMIAVITDTNLSTDLRNFLIFLASATLLPQAFLFGKKMGVEIFCEINELSELGFLFTMNQALYLLIVIWAFRQAPDEMVMIYSIIYGAHLLPYSWLYKSKSYKIFAIAIPLVSFIIGNNYENFIIALVNFGGSILFAICLKMEGS